MLLQRVNKRKLRRLALTDPAAFRAAVKGARGRELTARYLLLNVHEIRTASNEARAALDEYVACKGWRSLYMHDRRMYRFLRKGAEQYGKLKSSLSSGGLP